MSADARQGAQEGQQTPSPAEVASVPTVDPRAVVREHWRDVSDAGRWMWCVACGQHWRGGAADGGCTARLLALRVALLEGLLREHEWGGYLESTVTGLTPMRYCQFCFGGVWVGHTPDCRFVAALADGG